MKFAFKSALIAFTVTLSLSALAAQQELTAATASQEKNMDRASVATSGISVELDYAANHGHLIRIFRSLEAGAGHMDMIEIPVIAQNERCEGANTLGFALMAEGSFATGKYKNMTGLHIHDLFGDYQGQAQGAGALVGYGKWSSKSATGARLVNSETALPIPILGGDIALGYTNCKISFSLIPEGKVEFYGDNHQHETLNVEDVLDWGL